MSSCPEFDGPITPAVTSARAEKRGVRTSRPAQPFSEDDSESQDENNLLAAHGLLNSDTQRARAVKPAPPRTRINRRSSKEDSLLQRSAAAPQGPRSGKQRLPAARPIEQRYMRNSNDKPDSSECFNVQPPQCRNNAPSSRIAGALSSRNIPNRQETRFSDHRAGKCNGMNCQWRLRFEGARSELDRRDEELIATKEMLEQERRENRRLKTMEVVEPKHRERPEMNMVGQQIRVSAKEQKRQEKLEAAIAKRQHALVAARERRRHGLIAAKEKREHELIAAKERREHELAMEGLQTKEEARLRKVELAANLVATAGKKALQAHRKRQGQVQLRQEAEGVGVDTTDTRPAKTRRPVVASSSDRAHGTPPPDYEPESKGTL